MTRAMSPSECQTVEIVNYWTTSKMGAFCTVVDFYMAEEHFLFEEAAFLYWCFAKDPYFRVYHFR